MTGPELDVILEAANASGPAEISRRAAEECGDDLPPP